MKTKLIISAIVILIAVAFSCKKDPQLPTGGNKIEMGETIEDTTMYYNSSVTSSVTTIAGNTITQHGHCWSTDNKPTIEDNHTSLGAITSPKTFTSELDSLEPNTKYYVRMYLNYSHGIIYGDEISITTLKTGMPTVNTSEVKNITLYTAQCGGNATADSGLVILAKGVCWDTVTNVNIQNNIGFTTDGDSLGTFTSEITDLHEGVNYYVKAYSTNEQGTSYGEAKQFSTVAITLPEVTTTNITGLTMYSAHSGGVVTNDGNGIVTARGVCWSATPNPTITDNHTSDGTGTGAFESNITGLSSTTQYYARAYAVNSAGTAYGNEISFTTLSNAILPSVTTDEATTITQTTAISGGNVTSDGGGTVSTRGVCWSTTPNPSLTNSFAADGSGTGTFTSNINGLIQNTTYYLRAYATNDEGTAYGNQISFNTLSDPVLPTVTTKDITNIAQTTANSGGNVTNDGGAEVTARGVCWSSTNIYPDIDASHTTDGTGTGEFTSLMTNLTPNTFYYVRSYATNSVGTRYGNTKTFLTIDTTTIPTVTTSEAINITQTGATTGGTVHANGGATVTARGVCYSTTSNPTLADTHTTNGNGLGTFISILTSLTPNTQYYVRAYATNSEGTAYGNEITFITLSDITLPTVTTDEATNITDTTATSGGNVSDDGGADVTARGVCWSTNNNPTLSDNFTEDGNGTGTFISELTGLTANTLYYVRAYATNSEGTAYGNEITFITLSDITLPTVTTDEATNITDTTATSGGNVSDDGGADVMARGVCWSTNNNPTLSDNFTEDGNGTGTFISELTGLTESTLYYVRAYATNSEGTAYGNEITFTTLQAWQCGELLNYEGRDYTTVLIGNQCWMKENLNVGSMISGTQNQTNNSQIEKYCYDNDENNCDTYGGLYQWDEMMQYTTTQGAQGICPSGWHVPTDDEWKILEGVVDSQYGVGNPEWDGTGERGFDVGKNLKSINGWLTNNGTNTSNFTAFPGGYRQSNAIFNLLIYGGFWWSSTEQGSTNAWNRDIYHDSEGVNRTARDKNSGYSLRCIKD